MGILLHKSLFHVSIFFQYLIDGLLNYVMHLCFLIQSLYFLIFCILMIRNSYSFMSSPVCYKELITFELIYYVVKFNFSMQHLSLCLFHIHVSIQSINIVLLTSLAFDAIFSVNTLRFKLLKTFFYDFSISLFFMNSLWLLFRLSISTFFLSVFSFSFSFFSFSNEVSSRRLL